MTVLYYTLMLNITLFNVGLRQLFNVNMDELVPHSKCGPYILVNDAHLFTGVYYHIITYYMVLSHACNPDEDRWSTQSNFTAGFSDITLRARSILTWSAAIHILCLSTSMCWKICFPISLYLRIRTCYYYFVYIFFDYILTLYSHS